MPTREAIIDNVEMYSAEELVGYIKQGVVTFDELCKGAGSYFSHAVREEVKSKLENAEEDDWKKAMDSRSVDLLENYLKAYPEGGHRDEARAIIAQCEKERKNAAADNIWETVDKDSINSLKEFCNNNPNNPHCADAQKRINQLQKEEFMGFDVKSLEALIKGIQANNLVLNKAAEIYKTIVDYIERKRISRSDLLNMLQSDNNIIGSAVVDLLLNDGYLKYDDFEGIGINTVFVKYLTEGKRPQNFLLPKKIEKINKQSTEVYFWGIPSSGKSCALGAILSVANNGKIARSMAMDNDCQGYGYMNRLVALFGSNQSKGSVCTLPASTSIFATYEMGFDLEDENGATHPITCVDLAGELVRCMYKSDAGEPMSVADVEALETLTRILIDNRTKNRKIHFFVLEYGAEDREYEGLPQSSYLAGALRFIQRTGIFRDCTDAVYLMITKVDKAKAERGNLRDILEDYVATAYLGFYNGLKKICSRNDCDINDGNVEIVPFTLGKVCFQDYCLFDDKTASNVVRKLLTRSKGFKHGRIQKGLNIFKN